MNPEIKKNLALIGAPFDMAASLRGARLGPDAIRLAGIHPRLEAIGYNVKDFGNIEARNNLNTARSDNNLNNMEYVVEANQNLYEAFDKAFTEDYFPVMLGGDHSLAIGTIKASLKHYPDLGVLWIDAHGDINTAETSPSGNIHGMPVATLMGMGAQELIDVGQSDVLLKKENIVFVGLRDLDTGERKAIKELGIKYYTMHEVDSLGIKKVMTEALDYLSERTDHIHLSYDMDSLDPTVAPGTGTKVPGGMSYREAHLALEMISQTEKLVSVDLVEVNPILDEQNKTGEAAAALAGSLLGEWLI